MPTTTTTTGQHKQENSSEEVKVETVDEDDDSLNAAATPAKKVKKETDSILEETDSILEETDSILEGTDSILEEMAKLEEILEAKLLFAELLPELKKKGLVKEITDEEIKCKVKASFPFEKSETILGFYQPVNLDQVPIDEERRTALKEMQDSLNNTFFETLEVKTEKKTGGEEEESYLVSVASINDSFRTEFALPIRELAKDFNSKRYGPNNRCGTLAYFTTCITWLEEETKDKGDTVRLKVQGLKALNEKIKLQENKTKEMLKTSEDKTPSFNSILTIAGVSTLLTVTVAGLVEHFSNNRSWSSISGVTAFVVTFGIGLLCMNSGTKKGAENQLQVQTPPATTLNNAEANKANGFQTQLD